MTFDDLKFVRLRTDAITDPDGSLARFMFSRIPPYLFEQVKGADFKIERIYQFGPLVLMNPLTFFYALADKETEKIKGILWLSVNPFEEIFYVQMLSVNKEYQNNGDVLKETLGFIRSIPDYKTLKPEIIMMTKRTKAFEKEGWKRSEKVRMEI